MLLDGGDVPAPTTTNLGRKKRKRRQRFKEVYAKAREEARSDTGGHPGDGGSGPAKTLV
jgi:hypothetical protein